MTQCPVWKGVIRDIGIALQGLRPLLAGAKAVGRQDLAEAAVKALDHAAGLGMARRDKAVFNVLLVADPIEAVLAGRFPFAGRAEPVGKLLAVVGEDLGDPEGGGLEEMGQEALGAGSGLLRQDLDLHPARGTVDGGEQVAARALVRHLRQVLNVERDKAGGLSLIHIYHGLAGVFDGARSGKGLLRGATRSGAKALCHDRRHVFPRRGSARDARPFGGDGSA